jgi:hypothetical protein
MQCVEFGDVSVSEESDEYPHLFELDWSMSASIHLLPLDERRWKQFMEGMRSLGYGRYRVLEAPIWKHHSRF